MRHKFNAVRTEYNGKKFDSKLEARYAAQLDIKKKLGDVLFYLRQVPFQLPGSVTYRADFIVFLSDGTCEIVDCKGLDTPLSKQKRAQVEDLYPVKIKIVTAKEVKY